MNNNSYTPGYNIVACARPRLPDKGSVKCTTDGKSTTCTGSATWEHKKPVPQPSSTPKPNPKK